MSVAVIGGLGYIGRHIVQQLLVMGYKVLVIDKSDDRGVISALKKFDKSGKQLNTIKLSLPVLNSRFKDLIVSNNIKDVINVAGVQETPAKTLYLTRYIYCYLSTACKKVKTYVHATPMEDNLGYGYDKRLKLDVFPENWLSFHTIKDTGTQMKVGVLRLPEGYGHDLRLDLTKGKHLWSQLESIRNGALEKLPVHKETVQTDDGTPLRDYCSIFDIAGGVIDMMAYLQTAKGFDFAACDIGSGVNLSINEFVGIYEKHHGIKVITDPSLPGRPRPVLCADTQGGGEMIGWTRLVDSTILTNVELNTNFLEFEKHLMEQVVC